MYFCKQCWPRVFTCFCACPPPRYIIGFLVHSFSRSIGYAGTRCLFLVLFPYQYRRIWRNNRRSEPCHYSTGYGQPGCLLNLPITRTFPFHLNINQESNGTRVSTFLLQAIGHSPTSKQPTLFLSFQTWSLSGCLHSPSSKWSHRHSLMD